MGTDSQNISALSQKVEELTRAVDTVNVRQNEVFTPSLKRIEVSVQTIVQYDYLRKSEAKETYAPLSRVEALEAAQVKRDKYFYAVATVLIGIIVTAAYRLLTTGGL